MVNLLWWNPKSGVAFGVLIFLTILIVLYHNRLLFRLLYIRCTNMIYCFLSFYFEEIYNLLIYIYIERICRFKASLTPKIWCKENQEWANCMIYVKRNWVVALNYKFSCDNYLFKLDCFKTFGYVFRKTVSFFCCVTPI